MAALQTITETIPRRLTMSYEEYLAFAAGSQIVEWADGEAIIYMPPMTIHQDIVGFLSNIISNFAAFFNLGRLMLAPFEVKLWSDGPAREPDLLFINQQNLVHLTDHRYHGGPDLVVEVISPGSVSEDRVRKFRDYGQAGVREYWIIDPRVRQQQVDCYVLGEDGVFYPNPVAEDGRYHSLILPRFWFHVDWLWQKQLPNPQLALAEIMLDNPDLPAEARQIWQAFYDLLSPSDS